MRNTPARKYWGCMILFVFVLFLFVFVFVFVFVCFNNLRITENIYFHP